MYWFFCFGHIGLLFVNITKLLVRLFEFFQDFHLHASTIELIHGHVKDFKGLISFCWASSIFFSLEFLLRLNDNYRAFYSRSSFSSKLVMVSNSVQKFTLGRILL